MIAPSQVLSARMTSDVASVLLDLDEVEALTQSEGFTILRQHLAETADNQFCSDHTSPDSVLNARWLLVRDVLHALLVPIVELYDKAVGVASQVTRATRTEDLEFAFSGDARSAFVWLQCFLATETEQDWCLTRGCPACVVGHTLDSEFTIRLLYAACLLSDVHYPFTMEGPTLPSFTFFLECLERAIAQDEIFGDDFFERLQPKALATRDGIEELIYQCLDLDGVLSQPTSPLLHDPSQHGDPILAPVGGQPMMKLKRSKMAKRQKKVQVETEFWIEEILAKCWDQLHPRYAGSSNHDLLPTTLSCPLVTIKELVPE